MQADGDHERYDEPEAQAQPRREAEGREQGDRHPGPDVAHTPGGLGGGVVPKALDVAAVEATQGQAEAEHDERHGIHVAPVERLEHGGEQRCGDDRQQVDHQVGRRVTQREQDRPPEVAQTLAPRGAQRVGGCRARSPRPRGDHLLDRGLQRADVPGSKPDADPHGIRACAQHEATASQLVRLRTGDRDRLARREPDRDPRTHRALLDQYPVRAGTDSASARPGPHQEPAGQPHRHTDRCRSRDAHHQAKRHAEVRPGHRAEQPDQTQGQHHRPRHHRGRHRDAVEADESRRVQIEPPPFVIDRPRGRSGHLVILSAPRDRPDPSARNQVVFPGGRPSPARVLGHSRLRVRGLSHRGFWA